MEESSISAGHSKPKSLEPREKGDLDGVGMNVPSFFWRYEILRPSRG